MADEDADRIVGLYDQHADSWNRTRRGNLFEKPWLDRFLALVPRNSAILDIGCGTAHLARYFIEQGYHLTGVDSSPAMIAICEGRFPGQTWLVSDMRTLSLDRRFNGILGWDSLFHLRQGDQRSMFPIFRSHAAPGAALMFTSGPRQGEAIGTYQGEPLFHASLDPAEYRSVLDENGFEVVSYVAEDPACGKHTIWLAQLGNPVTQ